VVEGRKSAFEGNGGTTGEGWSIGARWGAQGGGRGENVADQTQGQSMCSQTGSQNSLITRKRKCWEKKARWIDASPSIPKKKKSGKGNLLNESKL